MSPLPVDITPATTRARAAARVLAGASGADKDRALLAVATALGERAGEILRANDEDVARARAEGVPGHVLAPLVLDGERLRALTDSVRSVSHLPDPVGRVLDGHLGDSGLSVRRITVPLGVVGLVSQGRPDVTVAAVAVCLKAGNALLLHGGPAAEGTTTVLLRLIRDALGASELPADCVQGLDPLGAGAVDALVCARGGVDVVVPSGDADMVRGLAERATVPVLETAVGRCHLFVDADADLGRAEEIVLDSTVGHVGAGIAVGTLLVHRDIAEAFLTAVLTRLTTAGVTVRVDVAAAQIAGCCEALDRSQVMAATEEDGGGDDPSRGLTVRVVEDLDAALRHIRLGSSGHTEAICTSSLVSARRFAAEVDAAVVLVNASTRTADGARWGMGAQIGTSTSRTQARGPLGVEQMTTSTWVVEDTGGATTRRGVGRTTRTP